MSKLALWLVSMVLVASVGCHGDDEAPDKPPAAVKAEPRRVPQVQPPIDVKEPPKDAAKTASGLSYKRLVEKSNGLQSRPGESVLIRYTGWRQRTGETFFTTGVDGQSIRQPATRLVIAVCSACAQQQLERRRSAARRRLALSRFAIGAVAS